MTAKPPYLPLPPSKRRKQNQNENENQIQQEQHYYNNQDNDISLIRTGNDNSEILNKVVATTEQTIEQLEQKQQNQQSILVQPFQIPFVLKSRIQHQNEYQHLLQNNNNTTTTTNTTTTINNNNAMIIFDRSITKVLSTNTIRIPTQYIGVRRIRPTNRIIQKLFISSNKQNIDKGIDTENGTSTTTIPTPTPTTSFTPTTDPNIDHTMEENTICASANAIATTSNTTIITTDHTTNTNATTTIPTITSSTTTTMVYKIIDSTTGIERRMNSQEKKLVKLKIATSKKLMKSSQKLIKHNMLLEKQSHNSKKALKRRAKQLQKQKQQLQLQSQQKQDQQQQKSATNTVTDTTTNTNIVTVCDENATTPTTIDNDKCSSIMKDTAAATTTIVTTTTTTTTTITDDTCDLTNTDTNINIKHNALLINNENNSCHKTIENTTLNNNNTVSQNEIQQQQLQQQQQQEDLAIEQKLHHRQEESIFNNIENDVNKNSNYYNYNTKYWSIPINSKQLDEELADLRGDREGVPPVIIPSSLATIVYKYHRTLIETGVVPDETTRTESTTINNNNNNNSKVTNDKNNNNSNQQQDVVVGIDDTIAQVWAKQIKEQMTIVEYERQQEKNIRQMPYTILPEQWKRLRPITLPTIIESINNSTSSTTTGSSINQNISNAVDYTNTTSTTTTTTTNATTNNNDNDDDKKINTMSTSMDNKNIDKDVHDDNKIVVNSCDNTTIPTDLHTSTSTSNNNVSATNTSTSTNTITNNKFTWCTIRPSFSGSTMFPSTIPYDTTTNIIIEYLYTNTTNIHIACGAKFGCDYLLYDGPRNVRHSFAGLRIIPYTTTTSSTSTNTTNTVDVSTLQFPKQSPYDLSGYVRCLNTSGKLALLGTVVTSTTDVKIDDTSQSDEPTTTTTASATNTNTTSITKYKKITSHRIAIIDLALEKVIATTFHRPKKTLEDRLKLLSKT